MACTLSKSNLKSTHDRTTLLFDSRGGLGEFRKKYPAKISSKRNFRAELVLFHPKIRKQDLIKAAGLKMLCLRLDVLKTPQIQSSS